MLAAVLGVTFIAALLVGRFFYRPFHGASTSMAPTVTIGDYFLVSTFAYVNDAPKPGDIIAFRHGGMDYIKRVVGLPGDHVQMVEGVLYINKIAVARRRVVDYPEPCEVGDCVTKVAQYEETLSNGHHYRVLDRGESEEDNTQDFSVSADTYFVMGDNRDNSDDSRVSMGLIKRTDVIGRATIMYMSRGKPLWRKLD